MNITNQANVENNWTTHFSPTNTEKQKSDILFWERATLITTVALCVLGASFIVAPFLFPTAPWIATYYISALQICTSLAIFSLPPCFQYLANQKQTVIDLAQKTEDLKKAHTEATNNDTATKILEDTFPTHANPLSKHAEALLNNMDSSFFTPILSNIIHWKDQLAQLEKQQKEIELVLKSPFKSYLNTITIELDKEVANIVKETSLANDIGLSDTFIGDLFNEEHSPKTIHFPLLNQINNLFTEILSPFKETETQKTERAQKQTNDLKERQIHLESWINTIKEYPITFIENDCLTLVPSVESLGNLITHFKTIQDCKTAPSSLNRCLQSLIRDMESQHTIWEDLIKLTNEDQEDVLYTNTRASLHELTEKILTAKLSTLFFWTLLVCSKDELQNLFQDGMKNHGIHLEKALYDFTKKKNLSANALLAAKEMHEGLKKIPVLKLSSSSVITRGELDKPFFVTEALIDKLLASIRGSRTPPLSQAIPITPATGSSASDILDQTESA